MQKSINNITLEVRKAYRFLFEYQKRIIDLVSFIEGKFGLKYAGGYPKFSNAAPRNGGGKLENWAWDWLNMYFYEFHFQDLKIGTDKIFFSVFIVNDTGFYKALQNREIERTNTDDFDSVEDSETKLIFVAAKNRWKPEEWGDWQSQEFLFTEELIKGSNDKITLSRIYSLESFLSEDNAIKSLYSFSELCNANGIPLNVKEKKA